MLAVPGPVPAEPGWGYEFKWDGVRAIADVARRRARLSSRNLKDMTASYPELAALADLAGDRRTVLDGEIVALDPARDTPSFARLQPRMHVAKPTAQLLTPMIDYTLAPDAVQRLRAALPSAAVTGTGDVCCHDEDGEVL